VAETVERISALIATTARRWLDLAAAVPDRALERPAATGEWSAVDCLRHLLQAERHVFPGRLEQFLAGSEVLCPVDPSAIPPTPETTALRSQLLNSNRTADQVYDEP
jgi:DinB superfamily